MRRARRRLSAGEEGQVVVMTALMAFFLLAILGIGLDTGIIWMQRRSLQTVADAAALAGVQELDCQGSAASRAQAESVAVVWAAKNDADAVVTDATATSNTLHVRVEKPAGTLLFDVFGIIDPDVPAEATTQSNCGARPFGIVALNENECGALQLSGDFDVRVNEGDVIVNSNCRPNAIDVEGNSGTLESDGTYVVGEADDSHGTIDPLYEESQPVPDPYETIPTPNVSPPPAPNPTDCQWGNGNGPPQVVPPGTYDCGSQGFRIQGNRAVTFSGGEYAFIGGLSIGSSGGTVTFGNGTYVFRKNAGSGDGFGYTGGRNIDATAGVLFHNTCLDGSCGTFDPGTSDIFDWTCTGAENSDQFRFAGNGEITAAPYGDPYSNVVFFQDRCSQATLDLSGTNAQWEFDPVGAIYGKWAEIDYGGTAEGGLQMVADTITIRGTVNLDIDVDGGATLPTEIKWLLIE